MPSQVSTTPPSIPVDNDRLIETSARERALFWKYPPKGPWTVTIRTPKREIEVSCQDDIVKIPRRDSRRRTV